MRDAPPATRRSPALALAVLALACAHGPAPTAPPPAPAPAPPAERLSPGRYGPEPAAVPSPLELQALEVATARFGRSGTGTPPRPSGSLSAAARLLAQAAARGAPDPLGRSRVRDALARGLSYDPAPTAYLARAGPARLREVLDQALAEGGGLGGPVTHLGVGVADAADGSVVSVVLAAQRKARLDPFPREVEAGASAVLSGEVRGGLRAPRVFVTSPAGQVDERAATGAGTFRAELPFAERGRYLVEVVAESPGGPAVAALLVVVAGGAALSSPEPEEAGEGAPSDGAGGEARVAEAIGRLRAAHDLAPLQLSRELSEVARRHSQAMRAARAVGHVVPGSAGAAERLAAARIAYQRVFENVAAARSALAAHGAAVESPAHLKNLLEPEVSLLGVGVAVDTLPSGDPRVYLTELLLEPPDDPGASRLTMDARIREALWRERGRRGLPPLTADAALDELAREGAVELRRNDGGEPPDLAPRALGLRRGLAAVDAFVAGHPREAARSANLRDARFRRVGVGVVAGESRRFGATRLYVAVLYTD